MSERIVSPCPLNAKRDIGTIKWTLTWMSWFLKTKGSKTKAHIQLDFTLQATYHRKSGHSFIIYKREIFRLLNAPKPAWDQLCLELPCMMGFRASEVATWKIEYTDFQHGQTLVFDAKKHVLLPVPLNNHVGRLKMTVIGEREQGYVLRNRSNAYQGRKEPLSNKAIWDIWKKHAYALNLFPSPKDYYPLVGRRFFARFYVEKLGLEHIFTLSHIMRHADSKQTLDYVDNITFAEDVEHNYRVFEREAMHDMVKMKVKT